MDSPQRPRLRVVAFIAAVVLGTTVVIVLTRWVTGSWSTGATAGVIAGTLSAAMYPLLIRKR
ncbi:MULTISPECIES: hypothetical protein [unclassified Arthrobacter]|uniref:hypothetical protein n=1 Tax=unclassified Arthrobacter TaxID=235627 RepID=UPI002DF916B3|nr:MULTISPECIES: hypothetical protein [unclassified Arthrobacter]MEC5190620.1 hypothetical protein [Arthrobacter sp. MP_M4]MEC5201971.1 hypothetical protein [Arthrobacter sp. MP_M7]